MRALIRRLRISLAGVILPAGSTVILPLSDEELQKVYDAMAADATTFCDEPNCLCKMQVLETQPAVEEVQV